MALLKAVTSCVIRWGSVYEMICRYKPISQFIKSMDDDDIFDLVPNKRETKLIEDVCEFLSQFNSVTYDDRTWYQCDMVLDDRG